MALIGSDDDEQSPLKYFTAITSTVADKVGVIGGDVVFSFTYTVLNPALVTGFFWQVNYTASDNSQTAWRTIDANPSFFSGQSTTSLTVKNINNWLATRPAVRFRCGIILAGTVVSFTNAAQLTVPVHLTWQPEPIAAGASVYLTPISAVADPAYLPTPVGFSGPYSYLWTRTGGDAFSIDDATLQVPTFSINSFEGFHFSVWTCKITGSNGEITSDPLYVLGYVAPPGFTSVPPLRSVPSLSIEGSAITGTTFLPGSEWTIITRQLIRLPSANPIQIENPNLPETTFGNAANFTNMKQGAIVTFVGYAFTSGLNQSMGFTTSYFTEITLIE